MSFNGRIRWGSMPGERTRAYFIHTLEWFLLTPRESNWIFFSFSTGVYNWGISLRIRNYFTVTEGGKEVEWNSTRLKYLIRWQNIFQLDKWKKSVYIQNIPVCFVLRWYYVMHFTIGFLYYIVVHNLKTKYMNFNKGLVYGFLHLFGHSRVLNDPIFYERC